MSNINVFRADVTPALVVVAVVIRGDPFSPFLACAAVEARFDFVLWISGRFCSVQRQGTLQVTETHHPALGQKMHAEIARSRSLLRTAATDLISDQEVGTRMRQKSLPGGLEPCYFFAYRLRLAKCLAVVPRRFGKRALKLPPRCHRFVSSPMISNHLQN